MKTQLIAPCGMNCGICVAYLREKNECAGCRGSDKNKPVTRTACKIKNCNKRNSEFCYDCEVFPCDRLNHLDKRYRTKYGMSMIENLKLIQTNGIEQFLKGKNSDGNAQPAPASFVLIPRHVPSAISP